MLKNGIMIAFNIGVEAYNYNIPEYQSFLIMNRISSPETTKAPQLSGLFEQIIVDKSS